MFLTPDKTFLIIVFNVCFSLRGMCLLIYLHKDRILYTIMKMQNTLCLIRVTFRNRMLLAKCGISMTSQSNTFLYFSIKLRKIIKNRNLYVCRLDDHGGL